MIVVWIAAGIPLCLLARFILKRQVSALIRKYGWEG